MMNTYSDSNDWKWLVRHAIDWEKILKLYHHNFSIDSKEGQDYLHTLENIFYSVAKWSDESLSVRAPILDREGAGICEQNQTKLHPILQKNYDEARDLGLYGLAVSEEHGGMGLPFSTIMLSWSFISKSCLATSCQLNFFPAMADMLERFCDEDTIKKYMPHILNGTMSGSMGLTEPDAGSDLGSLRTRATHLKDDLYKLNGNKIFITNPGGGFCFTLARIEGGPAGVEGISMFLVDQTRIENGQEVSNIHILKNEDKMGLKGSFTCQVAYENSLAKLVGAPHKGFASMLHLMNQSRIGVGLQAMGGIDACLSFTKDYASHRQAFGKPLLELPLYQHNYRSWETEANALRAFVVDTISHFDIYRKLDLKRQKTNDLNQEERNDFQRARSMMIQRTPLVKYYSSELFVTLSAKAMQALGSYGYTTEYPVERWHRDSFGPLMYEGTSQVQSLMALKELIKSSMRNPKKFFYALFGDNPIGHFVAGPHEHDRYYNEIHFRFYKNLGALLLTTVMGDVSLLNAKSWADLIRSKDAFPESKIEKLMVHAETITQSLCYLETLDVLRNHAKKDPARVALYKNYFELVNPRLTGLFATWKTI